MNSPLQTFSHTEAPLVLKEMHAFFAERKKEAQQSSPHFLHSIENLEEFVFRGGKNIRSLLVVLAYRLAGGTDNQIYRVAAGVELFHKHLLALDDMADRDEQRNGGPTLWKQFETEFVQQKWVDAPHHGRTLSEINTTLLGSFAFEMVRSAQFPAALLIDVMGLMHHLMYWQTVEGWEIQYYQNHQSLKNADEAEFLRGLDLVTAQYTFVAPLRIGLTLAKKGDDVAFLEPIQIYAQHVGRAFQITDDILGLYGDPTETGKPVGNDVREGKKTLLLQHAYRDADANDRAFLEAACGREISEKELQRVQKIVEQTGSLAYSKKFAMDSAQKGIVALEKLPMHGQEVDVLKELAMFVVMRKA